MTVHQFVHSFSAHDAQGKHALALRHILRQRWPDTWLWAEHIPGEMHGDITHFPWYAQKAKPGDVLVYHASSESPINSWLLTRPEPLVVIYHNVTPTEFMEPFDDTIPLRLRNARAEIPRLAARTTLAFGVSQYNADELRNWGFPEPAVMPLHIDLSTLRGPVDTRLVAALREQKGGDPGVVFHGRIAPNKCQHDLLRMYRVLVESRPGARLWCPGGPFGLGYLEALGKYRRALGLPVGCFPGSLSQSQWLAYYHAADVVLSLSEHEGFWMPAIEAMAIGVPVVAYASTAVTETVGGAGLLLDTKDPFVVAAAVERVTDDHALRERMIAAGHRKVDELHWEEWGRRFLDAVSAIAA